MAVAAPRSLEVLTDAAYLQVQSWLKPQLELVCRMRFQFQWTFLVMFDSS